MSHFVKESTQAFRQELPQQPVSALPVDASFEGGGKGEASDQDTSPITYRDWSLLVGALHRGVRVSLNGDRLRIEGPESSRRSVVPAIAEAKPRILNLLQPDAPFSWLYEIYSEYLKSEANGDRTSGCLDGSLRGQDGRWWNLRMSVPRIVEVICDPLLASRGVSVLADLYRDAVVDCREWRATDYPDIFNSDNGTSSRYLLQSDRAPKPLVGPQVLNVIVRGPNLLATYVRYNKIPADAIEYLQTLCGGKGPWLPIPDAWRQR